MRAILALRRRQHLILRAGSWHLLPSPLRSPRLLLCALVLFAAGEVTLFARHETSRVDDVEEQNCDPHWRCVEDVHVDFMVGNGAVDAGRVLD